MWVWRTRKGEPHYEATRNGSVELVRMLLEHGANLEVEDKKAEPQSGSRR